MYRPFLLFPGSAFGTTATPQGMTAQTLLEVVANTMPQFDPGSLKPEGYNDVTAYILRQNGYPAGVMALASGATRLKVAKIAN